MGFVNFGFVFVFVYNVYYTCQQTKDIAKYEVGG